MQPPWKVGRAADAALLDPVAAVRPVLKGGSLLVIGGDQRPRALAKLEREFQLRATLWATTRDTDPSPSRFRHVVGDPHVDVVVLLEGLVRHQHARDVAELCKRHGKVLVRLWRSPNPSALAHAILEQATSRLGLTPDAY